MTFGLEGDVALLEEQSAVPDEPLPVGVGRIELGPLVLEDNPAVDKVPDDARPIFLPGRSSTTS